MGKGVHTEEFNKQFRQINFRIDRDLWTFLKLQSIEEGSTLSAYIHTILWDYKSSHLRKQKEKKEKKR